MIYKSKKIKKKCHLKIGNINISSIPIYYIKINKMDKNKNSIISHFARYFTEKEEIKICIKQIKSKFGNNYRR